MPTKNIEAVATTADTLLIAADENAVRNTEEIGAAAEAVGATVI